MDVQQLIQKLKPLIQKARQEGKCFFHKKVKDANEKPMFLSPDELEEANARGKYLYYPEE